MFDRIYIYQDKKGEFRWRRRDAANGKITGASTEGYENLEDAKANIVATQGGDFRVFRGQDENDG